MSWNNCKKCVFVHRSTFTSALFKVLLTLKLLHGSRSGAKGSTLEDIAMHMIKHFCLDGDIKSQVLSSLKYGVKMHFIQKRKEKFSLILPASSIHLAPCKFKNEETERIQCIFPSTWYSNVCNDICSNEEASCCGKRKRMHPNVCCQQEEEVPAEENPCALCKKKKQSQQQQVCSEVQPCSKPPPCPRPKPPPCPRPSVCPKPRVYSKPCEDSSSSSVDSKTSVSSTDDNCSSCYPQPKKLKRKKSCPKTRCRKIQQPVCARRKTSSNRAKSPYDDYCQFCPQVQEDEDDDEPQFASNASVNCSCCNQ